MTQPELGRTEAQIREQAIIDLATFIVDHTQTVRPPFDPAEPIAAIIGMDIESVRNHLDVLSSKPDSPVVLDAYTRVWELNDEHGRTAMRKFSDGVVAIGNTVLEANRLRGSLDELVEAHKTRTKVQKQLFDQTHQTGALSFKPDAPFHGTPHKYRTYESTDPI